MADGPGGSGPEGPRGKDYHRDAVAEGRGTFAGELHRNVILCGYADEVSLIVTDSIAASTLFADASLAWVHLDARHESGRSCARCRPRIAPVPSTD